MTDVGAAERALQAWTIAPTSVAPLSGGLINATFLVHAGPEPSGRYVLQRLHPIFGGEVNEDIAAITAHLAAKGLVTPRLVPSRAGALWETNDDGVWRMQTFIAGRCIDRVDSAARARAAGDLLGRFHAALADFSHSFSFTRAGVHDTAHHFALLDTAVDAHVAHPEHARVAALRDELRAALTQLPSIANALLPTRIAHGDLKISNLLFDDDGNGLCLVDLDTVCHMPLPFELGDAWRSWCNLVGEDATDTRFELPLFLAAWEGYAPHMSAVITPEERERLVPGIMTICLELSARFARDVLEDRYFGWDPQCFASRAEHNWVRARSQATLYRSLAAQRAEAERALTTI